MLCFGPTTMTFGPSVAKERLAALRAGSSMAARMAMKKVFTRATRVL